MKGMLEGLSMENDRLIDIDEAAALLCTSKDFLYHNWKTLPFAVKFSKRQLRFSFNGIQQWIEEQKRGRTHLSTKEDLPHCIQLQGEGVSEEHAPKEQTQGRGLTKFLSWSVRS
jgi:predicted DNA-binding transcriptional regulator AlpA